jgi:hypothetical protein
VVHSGAANVIATQSVWVGSSTCPSRNLRFHRHPIGLTAPRLRIAPAIPHYPLNSPRRVPSGPRAHAWYRAREIHRSGWRHVPNDCTFGKTAGGGHSRRPPGPRGPMTRSLAFSRSSTLKAAGAKTSAHTQRGVSTLIRPRTIWALIPDGGHQVASVKSHRHNHYAHRRGREAPRSGRPPPTGGLKFRRGKPVSQTGCLPGVRWRLTPRSVVTPFSTTWVFRILIHATRPPRGR